MTDNLAPITLDRVALYCSDSHEVLPLLEPEQFTACVCDPPYHLTQASRKGSPRNNDPGTPFGRTRLGSRGFTSKTWDGGDIAFRPEFWAEVLCVLKPGACPRCDKLLPEFAEYASALKPAWEPIVLAPTQRRQASRSARPRAR